MMGKPAIFIGRRPRVAVIASSARGREYGRRALRYLGCTVLIFLSVEEFLEIGERARELAMLYLEHAPSDEQDDAEFSDVGERVRLAVGDAMPIAHSITVQSGGVVPGFRAKDVLLPSSISFAQLCKAFRTFLHKQGLPVNEQQLEWGSYRFCIDSGLIFVRDKPVVVKQDEFDLALELFFNVGSRVSRSWLKTMVPSLQTLRKRATAPAADVTLIRLCDLLNLKPGYGWELLVSPGLSCMLLPSRSVEPVRSESQHLLSQ